MKMYHLYWLSGEVESASALSIEDAVAKLGYGGNALSALDFYAASGVPEFKFVDGKWVKHGVEEQIAQLQKEKGEQPTFTLNDELTHFSYAGNEIALHGGIPRNTSYDYVSSSFLNGLVNYCGIKRSFIINRYGLEDDKLKTYSDVAAHLSTLPHTLKQYDDVLMFGETETCYWLFWYDMDCSDCNISRIDKDLVPSLDELALRYMESLAASFKNWVHHEAEAPIFTEFVAERWIRL